MRVSAIAAMAKNRAIGLDNEIPWYLPADLKYFKRTTLNHHIIMGRKSYEAIGRPLPKRTNVIVTRNPFFVVSNALVVHSVEEALQLARDNGEEEAFIIGGGEIYRQSMVYWQRLYLTEVDCEVKGDVFFPELEPDRWRLISSEPHPADEKNEFSYTFKVFERVSAE
ncbi:MAG: type 3 dihydrofolate reductase [Saprospiraceae bacterium]|nr:type 3 dihydrofolate reductase [Saprospiraceae bacterium]